MTDGDGMVDKLEFLQKMLVRLGKCETVDIDEIIDQFDNFDVSPLCNHWPKQAPECLGSMLTDCGL